MVIVAFMTFSIASSFASLGSSHPTFTTKAWNVRATENAAMFQHISTGMEVLFDEEGGLFFRNARSSLLRIVVGCQYVSKKRELDEKIFGPLYSKGASSLLLMGEWTYDSLLRPEISEGPLSAWKPQMISAGLEFLEAYPHDAENKSILISVEGATYSFDGLIHGKNERENCTMGWPEISKEIGAANDATFVNNAMTLLAIFCWLQWATVLLMRQKSIVDDQRGSCACEPRGGPSPCRIRSEHLALEDMGGDANCVRSLSEMEHPEVLRPSDDGIATAAARREEKFDGTEAKGTLERVAQVEARKAKQAVESAQARCKELLQKALLAAGEGRLSEALNLAEAGSNAASRAPDACKAEAAHLKHLVDALCRVVSRSADPRDWSVQDVTDYLQLATGNLSLKLLQDPPLDGQRFVSYIKFFLVKWTGVENKETLERMQSNVDNMILDADLARGEFKACRERVIKYSDVRLEDRPIGSGSCSEVYPGCWHGVQVAVKIFKGLAASHATKSELESLVKEVEAMRKCAACQFVVKCHGVMIGKACGIVMERLDYSLLELMQKQKFGSDRRRLHILLDTARGLQSIHQAGMCHGDIKPSNLLICTDGTVKISDFGLSKRVSTVMSIEDATRMAGGTHEYMAPEVWSSGPGTMGDMWAFGLVVWHMLTGRPSAWSGKNQHQIMHSVLHLKRIPDVDPATRNLYPQLASLFDDCCRYEASTRPAAADAVRSLEQMLRDLSKLDELPSGWLRPAGRDLYDVLMVEVPAGSAEYLFVCAEFAKTCPQHRILGLQQIQNLEQWNLYREKKQAMDTRNKNVGQRGSNERWMFHGTSADTVSLINQKSFNRSYCGRNAVTYGQGVYFARDASYSIHHRYSMPDARGRKYMYMVRVLVGATTPGHKDMREPPPMPGSGRSFDTTCGLLAGDTIQSPSIVVCYHDAQAYPQYLLTLAA